MRYYYGMRIRYTVSRRRPGLRKLILTMLSVVVLAQFGAIRLHQLQQKAYKDAPPPAARYATEAECEQATGKDCGFVMCDYVPSGKTFEEVCGGVAKGWEASSGPPPQDNAAPADNGEAP